MKIQREGYEEPVTIPKAERATVELAVQTTVRESKLWLTSGPASILAEEIPAGLLTDDARLQPPPQPIPAMDVLPANLPEAWGDKTTTALAISVALSKKMRKTLPWANVCEPIDGAFRARLLERTLDSGAWPCDYVGAQIVKLRLPSEQPPPPIPPPPLPTPGVLVAEAELRPHQIQDLADIVSDLIKAAVGHTLRFRIRVELGGSAPLPDEVVEKVNAILKGIASEIELR